MTNAKERVKRENKRIQAATLDSSRFSLHTPILVRH